MEQSEDLQEVELITTLRVDTGVVLCATAVMGRVWCGCLDGSIRVRDGGSRQLMLSIPLGESPINSIITCHNHIWAALGDGRITVWSPQSGDLLTDFAASSSSIYTLKAHKQSILAASQDGSVLVFHAKSFEQIAALSFSSGRVCAIESDGEYVWTLTTTGALSCWDDKTYRCIEEHQNIEHDICKGLLYRQALWIGCENGAIQFWDLQQSRFVGGQQVHESSIIEIYGTQDRIFTGSNDSTIVIWHAENQEALARLTNHMAPVTSIIAVDPMTIWSCSRDAIIAVWNKTTHGEEIITTNIPTDVEETEQLVTPSEDIEALHRELQAEIDLRQQTEVRLDIMTRENHELRRLLKGFTEKVSHEHRYGATPSNIDGLEMKIRELTNENAALVQEYRRATEMISQMETEKSVPSGAQNGIEEERLKNLIAAKDALIQVLLQKKTSSQPDLASSQATNERIRQLEEQLRQQTESIRMLTSDENTDGRVKLLNAKLLQQQEDLQESSKKVKELTTKLSQLTLSTSKASNSSHTYEEAESGITADYNLFIDLLGNELQLTWTGRESLNQRKDHVIHAIRELQIDLGNLRVSPKVSSKQDEPYPTNDNHHSLRLARQEIAHLKDEISLLRIQTPREIRPAPNLLEQELAIMKMKLEDESAARIAAELQLNSLSIELSQWKSNMQLQHASTIDPIMTYAYSSVNANVAPLDESAQNSEPRVEENASSSRSFSMANHPGQQPTGGASNRSIPHTESRLPETASHNLSSKARSSYLKSLLDTDPIRDPVQLPSKAPSVMPYNAPMPSNQPSLAARLAATRTFNIRGAMGA